MQDGDGNPKDLGMTVRVGIVVVATVIIITAIFWFTDKGSNPSNTIGSPMQTTGSAVNSRSTAGSDTSSTGRR